MSYESIESYVLPITRLMINLICIGTITRCILLILQRNEEDSFMDIYKKLKLKIWAGILSICIVEIINLVANVYS